MPYTRNSIPFFKDTFYSGSAHLKQGNHEDFSALKEKSAVLWDIASEAGNGFGLTHLLESSLNGNTFCRFYRIDSWMGN